MMRTAIGAFTFLTLLITALPVCAGTDVPDITGTWRGDFTIVRTSQDSSAGPNPLAFTKPGFHKAEGVTYVIDKQEGPVFSGTESYRNTKQAIVGVIQYDNKHLHIVDRYGMLFGEIITPRQTRPCGCSWYHNPNRLGQIVS